MAEVKKFTYVHIPADTYAPPVCTAASQQAAGFKSARALTHHGEYAVAKASRNIAWTFLLEKMSSVSWTKSNGTSARLPDHRPRRTQQLGDRL